RRRAHRSFAEVVSMKTGARAVVGLSCVLIGTGLWWIGCGEEAPAPSPAPEPAAVRAPEARAPDAPAAEAPAPAADFVEEGSCAACHATQASAWTGSDHDLAMQPASDASVLGDFAGARFQDASTDTSFSREGGGFRVETEGPDGARATFDVPYVFGLRPLQQVLLPLSKGRLQALSVAWDTQSKRWFSLYPDERIDAKDPLHWTKAAQNWNFSCAECHATNLARNYDPATDGYATTWNRLDVGCQACHGPAGRHVEWALDGDPKAPTPGHGFDVSILAAASSEVEIEACARCHARRAPLGD